MLRTPLLALSAFFVLALCATNAQAQATRTWVSGVGDDANPCSRTAPCRTFAGAISKTMVGGEIDALDPAAYGPVTITKALTIDGGAGLSGVQASTGSGITINASGTDVVVLRNLSISSASTANVGLNGINILSAGAVHVEDTVIANFSVSGINAASSATATALYVKNTAVRGCATALLLTAANVLASPTATLSASVWNSSFVNSPVGINVVGVSSLSPNVVVNLALYNTVLSGHSVAALQTSGAPQVAVDRGVIANSAVGINATGGNVRLSGVMLSQNVTGLVSNGGTVASYGNNALSAGNQTNGSATITLPLQ